MALGFPNNSRSYDAAHDVLSFWGYDSAFEITFRMGKEALHKLTGDRQTSEAAILRAFDTRLSDIRAIAMKLYRRAPKRNLELSLTDF